jgi:cellulose biosynthesis protein BcsQ
LQDDELQRLWMTPVSATFTELCSPWLDGGLCQTTIAGNLSRPDLIAGDLGLSSFEDQLSEQWSKANDDNEDAYSRAFDVLTAFWRCAQQAADDIQADLIIFDIGPNLGAINRSVLLGTDHVIVPLGADLFSLRGLQNIGPALRDWHRSWETRSNKPFSDYALPKGDMHVLGYVAMQHQERLYRPVQAYKQWVDRIPADYRQYILDDTSASTSIPKIEDDPYALALLRHHKSIIPIGQKRGNLFSKPLTASVVRN